MARCSAGLGKNAASRISPYRMLVQTARKEREYYAPYNILQGLYDSIMTRE